MKKYMLLSAAVIMWTVSMAQHTEKESKTEIQNDKAMLDGKAYAVTLTENTAGATGAPGSLSQDMNVDHPDMTKRDVEDRKADKAGSSEKDVKNRKLLIRFENGDVKLSGKGEIKNEKCPYKSWGMESTGISFSSDCSSTNKSENNSTTSTLLTGTVNGDTVHGTITCNKADGSVKTYSYTGSKAGPNDLDLENEMGMN